MKFFIPLFLIMLAPLLLYPQVSHSRNINIEFCNEFDLIFIGEIISCQKISKYEKVFRFSVEEFFKSRTTDCEVILTTWGQMPGNINDFPGESCLIFGREFDEEMLFDFKESTGLDRFQTYPPHLIGTDILYLQELVQNPDRQVKERYQSTGVGCLPDNEYFVAEGSLVAGFPHGKWQYTRRNGTMKMEGWYQKGRKWGVWYEYRPNGIVAVKSIYWDARELMRIEYDYQGGIRCMNEDCIF